MATSESLPSKTRLKLDLHSFVSESHIQAYGEVSRCKKLHGRGIYHVAVRFTEISPKDLEQITSSPRFISYG